MQRLYTCDSLPEARQLSELLRGAFIECLIKNEFLSGALGDLPPNECWPEVWVVEDHQFDKARALLDAYRASEQDAASGVPWRCQCGEVHDSQFSACWKCGHERAPFEQFALEGGLETGDFPE